MDYTLKFKKEKKDKGYWYTTIYAENDKEAIAKVEELRNYIVNNMEDIKVLIQAVKQLNKKVKKLEEDKI